MRPYPVEHALEFVLHGCRMRVRIMPDAHRCSSLHADESGPLRGHFHLVDTEECLLMGPMFEQRLHLHRGDLAIFLSGTRHIFVALPREHAALPASGCAATLYGEFELPQGNLSPLLHALPSCVVIRSRAASQHFQQMADILLAVTRQVRNQRLVINELASTLLTFGICEYAHQTQSPHGIFAALLDERIARVLRAIHDRPGADWGIRSLAAVAGMSRSMFAQQFSRVMNVPPMQYVRSWRIDQAQRLLQDNRLSVAQVAGMLGYHSETAFRKRFTIVAGISPGKARAAAKVTQTT